MLLGGLGNPKIPQGIAGVVLLGRAGAGGTWRRRLLKRQHHEGEGDPRSLAQRRANSVQFATALKVDLGTKRPASREYPHPHKHDVLLMCHG